MHTEETKLTFNRRHPRASRADRQPRDFHLAFPPHQRLCFYPSSGASLLWAVMQLDCDLFVFSDNDKKYSSWEMVAEDFSAYQQPLDLLEQTEDFVMFRSGEKTGVLIWEDNNLVRDRLAHANLQVHHFVGICDGCCEGGNYECVNDRSFMRQLLPIAASPMSYTTDHSPLLQPFLGHGMWHRAKFRDWMTVPFGSPNGSASFDLLGVLVRPPEEPKSLVVLPKGSNNETTQLDVLRPFRTLTGHSILAEYSVWTS